MKRYTFALPGAEICITLQGDMDFVPVKGEFVPNRNKRVLIFSNVQYPADKRVLTNPDDVLVFLNKAGTAKYYENAAVERIMTWRRTDDPAFGLPLSFGENHTVFPEVPEKFIEDLKRAYDWNFTCWDGRGGDMTTGYIVVKYMEHIYPDREIVLVNFGYAVKNSTRRTPNHNWHFEDRELQKYRHIFTADMIEPGKVIRIYYEQYGWLGDNVYASAVIENLFRAGYAVNVNPKKHPELWEKCPYLDRTITPKNADYSCKQRYRGMWRIGCRHIIEGTLRTLCDDIGIDVPFEVKKPKLYLDLPPDRLIDGEYWVINTGWQKSCELKKWRRSYWEKLIALAPEGVKIVQIGQSQNNAVPLDGTIDMIDRTTVPLLAQLIRDSSCVISPPSGVIHIAAALNRPFVAIAGGREPESYGTYPCGITLTVTRQLSCCRRGGCRKASFGGGGRVCVYPERPEGETGQVARCMGMITPETVLAAVREAQERNKK